MLLSNEKQTEEVPIELRLKLVTVKSFAADVGQFQVLPVSGLSAKLGGN